ncbi:hypothetical protein JYU34_007450 [Plutella xylostella]|uniref:KAP NTPase domain-containing protein n=1 Tax=Plutella xylostella TaxID=51655 RepID=A0ABQ7QQG7_PLUXY|nr:hypothetical protein JYU34_007450 [Plutella xylostella]
MVVQMMASLAEALESQYGRVCTRLARAFRPKPVAPTAGWRWRRVCCVPHIVTFEVVFTCVLVGLCVLILYLTETDADENRRAIQQGIMIFTCALSGVIIIANLYTWGVVLGALLLGPRARLNAAARRGAPALALRPEVHATTSVVSCLDAFTGQQTRLVVVVDALDSCEQEKVLALLNSVHALCSDPGSPFILLLAIDPHIISKAVEVNSRRAFSESNIGGWDYLRNMVQLPFYLQNSALRRVKVAQQTATRRMQVLANNDDLSASLQRSVSARRLSSTSELMSSQERIKPTKESTQSARTRRLRPCESAASSVASGLHRVGTDPPRILLQDDYFSDVNPRSMRRLMNVLYVTGRLMKAFQIDFNWYQLASWVNLTEQWPFRTSWILHHHDAAEDHIDDNTSLKHIYDKVKPLMNGLREAGTLMELDRDERKLEVFLSLHRATLTAADLKIFLPFTINLDPYIRKLIKEQQQSGAEEDLGGGGATGLLPWGTPPHQRQTHSKLLHRKQRHPPTTPGALPPMPAPGVPPIWVGWTSTPQGYVPQTAPPQYPPPPPAHPSRNPYLTLKAAFPNLGYVPQGAPPQYPPPSSTHPNISNIRLSTLSVEKVCSLVSAALGPGAARAGEALQAQRVCGMVLANCQLSDLKPLLDLPFGDWELFKMLVTNLKELEANVPFAAPTVAVIPDKPSESEPDTVKRPSMDHQRSRPCNVEKQVTLEEQMICGALQTLNEEAMEDVLQSEPDEQADEGATLVVPGRRAPAVTFSVEQEDGDGHITFTCGGRQLASPASDDEAAPLVSEASEPGSPRADLDLLPAGWGPRGTDQPLRHLAPPSDGRLWRQDALDAPPWPWDEPDSAV